MEDWYKVSQQIFHENFGSTLLNKYNGSPSRCVISAFGTHPWQIWKFAFPNSVAASVASYNLSDFILYHFN